MSDLLNSASLVMIPSGYKEDVVYSQIPTSGAGDLSFTRASNGTRINSAGLVEVCPWNLVQYSEDITNAVWGEFGATRSANTATAPNGTTTADTILPSATTSTHGIFQQITVANGIYSASAYFKANGYNYACIRIATNSDTTRYGVVISLIDGSVTATDTSGSPTNTSYSIETAGNGWFKLNVSCSHSSGFIYHTVGVSNVAVPTFANSLPSFTANGTSSIFIWGAQLNIGSTAKPYFPTTDRLNVPRLTYQNGGGGCPSLLLEPQRTNLALWSEDFTNAIWTKNNATISANATTSPDGTSNADKIIPDTNLGAHSLYQSITVTATTYAMSFYAKRAGYTGIRVANLATGVGARFDLLNGVLGTVSAGVTASIENVGNDWYRCIISFTPTAGANLYGFYVDQQVNVSSYAGNGTDGIFVWGAQLEASSYPTSCIPSTTSSATRVADLDTTNTIQTAQTFAGDFTIFADFVPFIDSTDANGMMVLGGGASGLGTTYRSYLWFVGSNVYLSGDGEVNIIQRGYSMVVNQRVKIALTRVGTTVKMFVNGAQVGASATSSLSITIRSIGWSYNLPTYQTQGKINQVVLSATGFSDADCQSLTTI